MKKILLPLFIILLLTGCSKIDKNTNEYKDIVNSILISDNKNVNTASEGYKYYIPIGVGLVYDGEFNKKFKVNDTELFLYVDVVSYYYKYNLNYVNDGYGVYYFSRLNDNGYISIVENTDNYYLNIVYNYARIESFVEKDDLVDIVAYSTIILNSITYNDVLISNLIEKGVSFGNEMLYEIEKPENSKSNFSQYLQEYVQDNSEDEKDDELPIDQD